MLPYKTNHADLKSKYQKYFKISLIITLILIIVAFKFSPKVTKIEVPKSKVNEPIIVEPEVPTRQKPELPSLPKPIIPIITADNITEEIEMIDISINENSKPAVLPVPINKIKVKDEEIFVAVEKMPEIIGGINSLQSKLYYPELARKAGVEGRVIVECIVGKEGSVESVSLIKGVIESLNESALNAVRQLKFSPGLQRGKPVKVKMTIPINFKLK